MVWQTTLPHCLMFQRQSKKERGYFPFVRAIGIASVSSAVILILTISFDNLILGFELLIRGRRPGFRLAL